MDEEALALILEIHGDVKLLRSHVIGNGVPGLVRRMTAVETSVVDLHTDKAVIRGKVQLGLVVWGLLSPFFGALIGKAFI